MVVGGGIFVVCGGETDVSFIHCTQNTNPSFRNANEQENQPKEHSADTFFVIFVSHQCSFVEFLCLVVSLCSKNLSFNFKNLKIIE